MCNKKVDTLSTGEAAKMLRVSVRTIQRWDREQRLSARRTSTGRRYYTRDQLTEFVQSHEVQWRPDRTVYMDRE